MRSINISEPRLTGREAEYVMDAIARNELTFGKYIDRFEQAFASYCGSKYAVSCSNGTAALHLSLLAQGVRPGDHVIIPALTYVATAAAVRYCGATPVFVDVDPHTWCIDVEDADRTIKDLLSEHARVTTIIPVHLYGVPCDMNAIQMLARRYRLVIIEDAAEAHGAFYGRRRVGSLGDFGTFSFYGNKVITCGEGGVVTCNDDKMYEKLKLFRGQGVSSSRRYWHTVVGYNYRMSNISAAIAYGQLENISLLVDKRRSVCDIYETLLSDYERQHETLFTQKTPWMFSVLVPREVDRDAVMLRMKEEGVETRPLFYPVTELPPYKAYGMTPPVAAEISTRGINLPTHPNLSDSDVEYICEVYQNIVSEQTHGQHA